MKQTANKSNNPQQATLTPLESIAITRFGVSATYTMLRDGDDASSIRVGKRFFIPRTALERWLESCGGRDAA